MKKHLLMTLMLATASLTSFATVEPTDTDSTADSRRVKLFDPEPNVDYETWTPSFSAITPSGHKLFFRIINKKQGWVEVVDSCGARVYQRLKGTLVIPVTINYGGGEYTVLYIGEGAMMNVGADSVIISEGIKEIKKYAFYYGKLEYVYLPQSLNTLGESSFGCCSNLLSVIVPGSKLRKVSRSAFNGALLKSVVIEEGVSEIDDYAFHGCSIEELTLPSTICAIGDCGIYAEYLEVVYSYIKKPFDITDGVYYSLYRINSKTKMYVPVGTADLYLSTEGWNIATIIEMTVGIEEEEIESTSTPSFYSANGILYSKEPVTYSVYDMVGRCMYTGKNTELSLPKGLYIVKTQNSSEKVHVR